MGAASLNTHQQCAQKQKQTKTKIEASADALTEWLVPPSATPLPHTHNYPTLAKVDGALLPVSEKMRNFAEINQIEIIRHSNHVKE